jgi:glycosyltransferase involved in cell wall biosynthesis
MQPPRRIAVLTLEYPPRVLGGAGTVITRVTESAARRGMDVHVLTPGTENRYLPSTEGNLYVHRLPSGPFPRWNVPWYWMVLPLWFGRIASGVGGFDLVHGSGIADLTLPRGSDSRPRIVTVYHLASTVVRILRPGLHERLARPGDEIGLGPVWESVCIRRADWITAISEFTRSDVLARFGLPPEKIRVIPLGTDLEGYHFPKTALADLRKELGASDKPMILFVGRLEPRKGIADLIESFSQFRRRQPAILVVVGSGDLEEYRRLATARGIRDSVVFRGSLPSAELKKTYVACDLVVVPSLLEGFGLAALEARAAGKFTVACRTGGLPEVVPEGSGYLVPPRDPAAFAGAMEKALRVKHAAVAEPRSWAEMELDYYRFYGEAASG